MLLNSHGQLEAFWNLSVMGCVGKFITESLLLSLVSSQKGGAGLGQRYTYGMALTVLLKMCVSVSRARRSKHHSYISLMHRFHRARGTEGRDVLL